MASQLDDLQLPAMIFPGHDWKRVEHGIIVTVPSGNRYWVERVPGTRPKRQYRLAKGGERRTEGKRVWHHVASLLSANNRIVEIERVLNKEHDIVDQ
jgi:hypothetical protein